MSNYLPEPITAAEFERRIGALSAEDILTPYSFALCCNLPSSEQNRLNERMGAVNARASALGLDPASFAGWYDTNYGAYSANPKSFVSEAYERFNAEHIPELVSLDGVRTQAVPWLIPRALARGELTLLGADGGTGKGLVQAAVIAAVTRGRPCEFWGEAAAPEAAGKVLIFAGEDDPARILRPRLLAAGADLSLVSVMTPELFYSRRHRSLTMADKDFGSYIAAQRPALVVIDPLQSFLPAEVDMARRNEMRAALTPLKTACAEVGAAGLIAMHTNKRQSVAGRQRLADSADLWDLARAVFMMGRDKDNKGTVYLSNEKNNYAAPLKTALFAVESAEAEGAKTARARFLSLTDKRDADFAEQRTRRTAALKTDVQAAILDELDSSPTASVRAEALRRTVMETTGCSERTYMQARADLSRAHNIYNKKISLQDGTAAWITFRY